MRYVLCLDLVACFVWVASLTRAAPAATPSSTQRPTLPHTLFPPVQTPQLSPAQCHLARTQCPALQLIGHGLDGHVDPQLLELRRQYENNLDRLKTYMIRLIDLLKTQPESLPLITLCAEMRDPLVNHSLFTPAPTTQSTTTQSTTALPPTGQAADTTQQHLASESQGIVIDSMFGATSPAPLATTDWEQTSEESTRNEPIAQQSSDSSYILSTDTTTADAESTQYLESLGPSNTATLSVPPIPLTSSMENSAAETSTNVAELTSTTRRDSTPVETTSESLEITETTAEERSQTHDDAMTEETTSIEQTTEVTAIPRSQPYAASIAMSSLASGGTTPDSGAATAAVTAPSTEISSTQTLDANTTADATRTASVTSSSPSESPCVVGPWSEWSLPFGFGYQSREREVLQQGRPCKELKNSGLKELRPFDLQVGRILDNFSQNYTLVADNFDRDFLRVKAPRDILVIVEASHSPAELSDMKESLKTMITLFCSNFSQAPADSRLAIIEFASDVTGYFKLEDRQSMARHVDFLSVNPGSICPTKALQMAEMLFSSTFGGRSDVQHQTLIITKGRSQCPSGNGTDVIGAAKTLQKVSEVFVLGIGVGNDPAALQELKSLATEGDDRHIFSLSSSSDLAAMMSHLKQQRAAGGGRRAAGGTAC